MVKLLAVLGGGSWVELVIVDLMVVAKAVVMMKLVFSVGGVVDNHGVGSGGGRVYICIASHDC